LKEIKTSLEGSLFIGDLGDCVSICTLDNKTCYLTAPQINQLIEELKNRLKEMNNTKTI